MVRSLHLFGQLHKTQAPRCGVLRHGTRWPPIERFGEFAAAIGADSGPAAGGVALFFAERSEDRSFTQDLQAPFC